MMIDFAAEILNISTGTASPYREPTPDFNKRDEK